MSNKVIQEDGMNVASASPELCKELYLLSGWENSDYKPPRTDPITNWPTYSLGFLLRKLPDGMNLRLYVDTLSESKKRVFYIKGNKEENLSGHWDSPEDALAFAYVTMFKQGILKAENKSED